MAMRFEIASTAVATTDFVINPTNRAALSPQHIYDSDQSVIATLVPLQLAIERPQPPLEYRMDSAQTTIRPIPALLLTALFARYFYDRMECGEGLMDRAGYWLSRPTWEQ